MARRALLLVLAGCALTSRGEPLPLRYFSPPPIATAPRARPACAHVELGVVKAAANLRYEIEHRVSPVEVRPYETLRWTEPPEAYVRRAIEHALFDTEPVDETTTGAPILDIDVLAFEETEQHAGRVRLRYELKDDTRVLSHGVITCERAATAQSIDRVVIAIGAALDEASGEVARRVASATCH